LLDVVRNAKPTTLIGVSGQAGAFTEKVVRAMAGAVERPVIFPLSNPTSRSEAKPVDLLKWDGRPRAHRHRQPVRSGELEWPRSADRSDEQLVHLPWPRFGYPIGKRAAVTDTMFMAARQMSRRTFSRSTQQVGTIVAAGFRVALVSFGVAKAVARQAIKDGVADPLDEQTVEARIRANVWEPVYLPYRFDPCA